MLDKNTNRAIKTPYNNKNKKGIPMINDGALYSIIHVPANIYPYLSQTTPADLRFLFTHADKRGDDYSDNNYGKCYMLKTFLNAGLNPQLIDASVQEVIFKSAYGLSITSLAIRELKDLFLKFNIPMSPRAQQCFLSKFDSNELRKSQIQFTNSGLSLAIRFSDYNDDIVYKIFNVVKPANLDVQTLLIALKKLLQKPVSGDTKNAIDFVINQISAIKDPESTNKVYEDIVSCKPALSYLYKYHPDFLKSMPMHLRPYAIKTWPNSALLKVIGLTDEKTQLAWCSAAPNSISYEWLLQPAKQCMKIIRDINNNNITPDMFTNLSQDVITVLIYATYRDKLLWYKAMEAILIACPDLPCHLIDSMRKVEPNILPLINKYRKESVANTTKPESKPVSIQDTQKQLKQTSPDTSTQNIVERVKKTMSFFKGRNNSKGLGR